MKKKILIPIIILVLMFGFFFACQRITYAYTGELFEGDTSRTAELTVEYPRYCEWFGHNQSASIISIDDVAKYKMQGKFLTMDDMKWLSFYSYNEKLNDQEICEVYFSEDFSEIYLVAGDVKFIAANDEFVKLVED